jgi:hypothetical protein
MRLSVTLCVSVAVFALETAAAAAPPKYSYRTTVLSLNGDFQVYDKVPAGTQKEYESDGGLLCYPKCKPGYTGHAFLCWQDGCPTGFRDDGAFCAKPAWTHEYRGREREQHVSTWTNETWNNLSLYSISIYRIARFFVPVVVEDERKGRGQRQKVAARCMCARQIP